MTNRHQQRQIESKGLRFVGGALGSSSRGRGCAPPSVLWPLVVGRARARLPCPAALLQRYGHDTLRVRAPTPGLPSCPVADMSVLDTNASSERTNRPHSLQGVGRGDEPPSILPPHCFVSCIWESSAHHALTPRPLCSRIVGRVAVDGIDACGSLSDAPVLSGGRASRRTKTRRATCQRRPTGCRLRRERRP